MPRSRIIPDATVFATIRRLLDAGGDKAVSFATVGQATGLAPPTLVQRYGSRDGMVRAARMDAWQRVQDTTAKAIAATVDKGPQALLKALGPCDIRGLSADLRDPELARHAHAWRVTVEAALAMRLGSGAKGREAAAALFAAWQGQALWHPDGHGTLRLKDLVKRLT
jgi:AcrR family transcriptional regulator